MKVIHDIIQAYLSGKSDIASPHESIAALQVPDAKRYDIVKELMHHVQQISEQFPMFNTTLWNTLFIDGDDVLQRIILYPMVGAPHHHIQKVKSHYYIYLDLIYIADTTHIVSQMVYVMQNYLMCEISKIAIRERFPFVEKNYRTSLDYICFTHGLANFLSWGENCKDYKLYSEKYEQHKERSFALLAQAIDVHEKVLQIKILKRMFSQSFWNQFAGAAGMFYFDDVFQEQGIEGIATLFQRGPSAFITHIFQS